MHVFKRKPCVERASRPGHLQVSLGLLKPGHSVDLDSVAPWSARVAVLPADVAADVARKPGVVSDLIFLQEAVILQEALDRELAGRPSSKTPGPQQQPVDTDQAMRLELLGALKSFSARSNLGALNRWMRERIEPALVRRRPGSSTVPHRLSVVLRHLSASFRSALSLNDQDILFVKNRRLGHAALLMVGCFAVITVSRAIEVAAIPGLVPVMVLCMASSLLLVGNFLRPAQQLGIMFVLRLVFRVYGQEAFTVSICKKVAGGPALVRAMGFPFALSSLFFFNK